MNIFFLDIDCRKSAKYYFNRHCIKIILEISQMLYTAHWVLQQDQWIQKHKEETKLEPYKSTHINHPITKWIRYASANYAYACEMGLALCEEYTRRYKKVHACRPRLEWLQQNFPPSFERKVIKHFSAIKNIPPGCSPVPLAMPKMYHDKDLLKAYRNYYLAEKTHVATKSELIPMFE